MSSLFEEYQEYRDTQVAIHTDILKTQVDEGRLRSAASLLGIRVTKKYIELEETETPSLYDFTIYDVRRGGKTALENYVDALGGIGGVKDPVRKILLRAMLSAKTSCYKIARTDPVAGTVVLADMLGGGSVTIYDRGISLTGQRGTGGFTRIVATPRLSMSAGATAVFKSGALRRAVSEYRRLEKRSDRRPEIKRYGLFFRLHRKYGVAMHYADTRTGKVERY